MAIKKSGVWWMGNGLMDGWVGGWWMCSKDGLRIAHSNQKLKQRNIFFCFSHNTFIEPEKYVHTRPKQIDLQISFI